MARWMIACRWSVLTVASFAGILSPNSLPAGEYL
jgi:hypothetical protein